MLVPGPLESCNDRWGPFYCGRRGPCFKGLLCGGVRGGRVARNIAALARW